MVEKLGRKWIGVKADVRDFMARKDAMERVEKEFCKLDIAVGNAAIQIYGPLAETTEANWRNVVVMNLTGCANTVRATAQLLIPHTSGRIILISSGQPCHRGQL